MSTERQPWYTIKTRDPVDAVAEILWFRHSTVRTGVEDFLVEAREIVGAVVNRIADDFDERAKLAAILPRGFRDIDAKLAWESGGRCVRRHAPRPSSAPAAAVSSPTGTPDLPPYAHEYTVTFDGDTHWLEHDWCDYPLAVVEAGGSLEELLTKVRDHNRTCTATSPTGDPTDVR